MKKGFGLLEVLVAALVLGFLVIALNRLQLGNREAILRIRARDAANIIAQHVLDSLGALGINSLDGTDTDPIINDNINDPNAGREYEFEGKNGKASMRFFVTVIYSPANSNNSSNSNRFIDENIDESTNLVSASSQFAKNIQATVKWKFKDSYQSIKMSKVVR
ncbi:MAG: prepilin-type N-terminal cleavage/methylation domain-containing protein [Fibromonadaceae bacterium]|jgi:prepilin-type N-terminal cleavage/methylation domain-containing protein|nr:prepilin-type N-terminal cleavage/methylation domain-containing protein [Fibromonadaceae bacterium]